MFAQVRSQPQAQVELNVLVVVEPVVDRFELVVHAKPAPNCFNDRTNERDAPSGVKPEKFRFLRPCRPSVALTNISGQKIIGRRRLEAGHEDRSSRRRQWIVRRRSRYATLAGHEVRLWRRNSADAEAHVEAGGTIGVIDGMGQRSAKIALSSSPISRKRRSAPNWSSVRRPPSRRTTSRARRAAKPSRVVFLPPGSFGSSYFRKGHHGRRAVATSASPKPARLPWLTRKQEPLSFAFQVGRAVADRRISESPQRICA